MDCLDWKAWIQRAGPMCQGQGLDDKGWRSWKEGGKGWRSWKEGVSESEPWKRGVARLEPWEGGMARTKQWKKEILGKT